MKSHEQINFAKNNNQMSSKPVSQINSPEVYTFNLPNKRITEESMDYTEKSRSEELDELQDIKQEAHKNYTNHKNILDKFRKNPFSVGSSKTDIDPFKEIKENRIIQLQASTDNDEIQQMYDEEAMMMNRISNLKDFRNLIQDYINLGVKINDQISLDDESLDDFKDGTILCDIVSIMEGAKIQSVSKNPKSKAS